MSHTTSHPALSCHAELRCKQRGIRADLLEAILKNADVERHARGGAPYAYLRTTLTAIAKKHPKSRIDDLMLRAFQKTSS